MSVYLTTLNNLHITAQKIIKEFPYERIFGFYGEMGAGKTTLIKELCKILEIENVTSSPTFAIINEYWRKNGDPVYHFDFYRINSDEEVYGIGFRDYLDSDQYCFIEWTEKIEHLMHLPFVKVEILKVSDTEREVICNIID
jgi:tRNA threonylcarbamoyladenosine biosynthesis protein TsaE